MRFPGAAARRAVAATLATAAILGTAAACASSSSSSPAGGTRKGPLAGLSADQIALRATDDLMVASSVHVQGSLRKPGESLALNISLGTHGCTGTMGIRGEGSIVLLKIGKTFWVKPDHAFWKYFTRRDGPAVADRLTGMYIKPSAKAPGLAQIGMFCNPAQLAKLFVGDLTGMVRGRTTTIAGQPALQIKDAGDAASFYVTVGAKPEFLRLDDLSSGRLDFTAYDAPLHLTPPPAARTLDGARYGF